MDLAKQLFDQAKETARIQQEYLKLGRAILARDVLAWAIQHADAIKGAPCESLISLCNGELK